MHFIGALIHGMLLLLLPPLPAVRSPQLAAHTPHISSTQCALGIFWFAFSRFAAFGHKREQESNKNTQNTATQRIIPRRGGQLEFNVDT